MQQLPTSIHLRFTKGQRLFCSTTLPKHPLNLNEFGWQIATCPGNVNAVSDAPHGQECRGWPGLGRVRYSRLKGAAFVCVGSKSTCGATVNLMLGALPITRRLSTGSSYRETKHSSRLRPSAVFLEFSMSIVLGHEEASAANRLRSNGLLRNNSCLVAQRLRMVSFHLAV